MIKIKTSHKKNEDDFPKSVKENTKIILYFFLLL